MRYSFDFIVFAWSVYILLCLVCFVSLLISLYRYLENSLYFDAIITTSLYSIFMFYDCFNYYYYYFYYFYYHYCVFFHYCSNNFLRCGYQYLVKMSNFMFSIFSLFCFSVLPCFYIVLNIIANHFIFSFFSLYTFQIYNITPTFSTHTHNFSKYTLNNSQNKHTDTESASNKKTSFCARVCCELNLLHYAKSAHATYVTIPFSRKHLVYIKYINSEGTSQVKSCNFDTECTILFGVCVTVHESNIYDKHFALYYTKWWNAVFAAIHLLDRFYWRQVNEKDVYRTYIFTVLLFLSFFPLSPFDGCGVCANCDITRRLLYRLM